LKGLVGNIKGVGVDSRRREGRGGGGGREEGKKEMDIDVKLETHFVHALPHRMGGQDLPKTTLKDGVGWLDGPACVVRTVQGSSTRTHAPTFFFNNIYYMSITIMSMGNLKIYNKINVK